MAKNNEQLTEIVLAERKRVEETIRNAGQLMHLAAAERDYERQPVLKSNARFFLLARPLSKKIQNWRVADEYQNLNLFAIDLFKNYSNLKLACIDQDRVVDYDGKEKELWITPLSPEHKYSLIMFVREANRQIARENYKCCLTFDDRGFSLAKHPKQMNKGMVNLSLR